MKTTTDEARHVIELARRDHAEAMAAVATRLLLVRKQAIEEVVAVINEAREKGETDLRQVRTWVQDLLDGEAVGYGDKPLPRPEEKALERDSMEGMSTDKAALWLGWQTVRAGQLFALYWLNLRGDSRAAELVRSDLLAEKYDEWTALRLFRNNAAFSRAVMQCLDGLRAAKDGRVRL